MEIKIAKIRLQNNDKPLKAFADIQLENGWIIKDFRVIQQPGQKAYVVAPQASWRNREGSINFKTLITIPNGDKWQLESAILAAYQREKEQESGSLARQD